MENVTLYMLKYREAARHLWNVFLREEGAIGLGRLPVSETLEHWEVLKDDLFAALVLQKTCDEANMATRLSAGSVVPFLRVVPTCPSVPAMVSRTKPAQTYWDNPVDRLGPLDDLRFIDFFDWDQSGFLDFAYYRVSVRSCERAPNLAGHEALIEVQYAQVFTVETVGLAGVAQAGA